MLIFRGVIFLFSRSSKFFFFQLLRLEHDLFQTPGTFPQSNWWTKYLEHHHFSQLLIILWFHVGAKTILSKKKPGSENRTDHAFFLPGSSTVKTPKDRPKPRSRDRLPFPALFKGKLLNFRGVNSRTSQTNPSVEETHHLDYWLIIVCVLYPPLVNIRVWTVFFSFFFGFAFVCEMQISLTQDLGHKVC